MDYQPVVLERTFDAPLEKVWAALTDNEKLQQWYFKLPEFKAEKGFEFEFLAGKDEQKWLHKCKITEVIANRKIAYSWRYEGFPGDSEVSFEIFPEGEKTRLVLTHTGIETFSQETDDFAKNNFLEGWTYFMDEALKKFLL